MSPSSTLGVFTRRKPRFACHGGSERTRNDRRIPQRSADLRPEIAPFHGGYSTSQWLIFTQQYSRESAASNPKGLSFAEKAESGFCGEVAFDVPHAWDGVGQNGFQFAQKGFQSSTNSAKQIQLRSKEVKKSLNQLVSPTGLHRLRLVIR